jgi:hypothetical protein
MPPAVTLTTFNTLTRDGVAILYVSHRLGYTADHVDARRYRQETSQTEKARFKRNASSDVNFWLGSFFTDKVPHGALTGVLHRALFLFKSLSGRIKL